MDYTTLDLNDCDPDCHRRIDAPENVCRVLVRMPGLDTRVQPGGKVRFNEGTAKVFAVDENSLTLEW